jgi:Tfp pilus assembly protein PilZ
MKRLLIGDSRERLLSTLEVILKHWGYRALVTSRPDVLKALVKESSPDLLIIGAHLLADEETPLWQAIAARVTDEKCPLIIIGDTEVRQFISLPHDYLEVPPDVFDLFALIQRHVNKYPRKNLRLTVQLPGMLNFGENCQLSQVISLSRQGLFIKTGFRLNRGDQLKVSIPLIGMQRELEVEGRVLYRILPDPENNYLQGVGVEFLDMDDECRQALESFIEKRFFGDLTSQERVFPGLEKDQLRSATTLRLL